MSSDAQTTEAPQVAGEAEAEPKKSMKERMAFLEKSGQSMDKVPGINKIPRSMRIVAVLIILLLIVAVIVVAWPSGEKGPSVPPTLNVDTLEDWSYTSDSKTGPYILEGDSEMLTLEDFIEGNGTTIFIERIEVTITWTDEPDGSIGPRQKENQPDTFQLEINSSSINVSAMSDQVSNTHGQSQSISLSVDIADSGFTYLVIGNTTGLNLGTDVIHGDVNFIVYMVAAGDHSSPPQVLIILDNGNDFSIEVTASGKVIAD